MVIQVPIDQKAIADFCRSNHIRKLAIFGSATRADFQPNSDVDVLVEFDPKHVPGFSFVDMQDELTQLLRRRVDLNTPGFLSPYIRGRILREALTIYERP